MGTAREGSARADLSVRAPRGSTLHDVAALAGVSPRTVSRVVNDEPGFGESTRQRVLEAIDRVGYRPNLLARALITKRTGTIGLVVSDMTDPFFAELADGVQQAAASSGRTMFFASHGNEVEPLDRILGTLSSFAVDGAIVVLPKGNRASVIAHAASGLRIVVLDAETEGPNVGSVVTQISNGAELAVEHLVRRGCRRVAMVANEQGAVSAIPPRRVRGFERAMHRLGFPFEPEVIEFAQPTIEGGRAAMAALLDRLPDVDGVFAYNDIMAIGALQTLNARGRRVPHDVALVGFDDIAICAALVPALTSVRLDRRRIAEEAVRMLGGLAESPGSSPSPVALDVELIVRDSA